MQSVQNKDDKEQEEKTKKLKQNSAHSYLEILFGM